ncbi:MAG: hypothetical protein AAFV72_01100 [Cyanobacteria bacterium J06635_1]
MGIDRLVGDRDRGRQYKDTFVLASGQGTNTIVDFSVGVDVIGLDSGLMSDQLDITQRQRGAEVRDRNGLVATLIGIDATELTAVSFASI